MGPGDNLRLIAAVWTMDFSLMRCWVSSPFQKADRERWVSKGESEPRGLSVVAVGGGCLELEVNTRVQTEPSHHSGCLGRTTANLSPWRTGRGLWSKQREGRKESSWNLHFKWKVKPWCGPPGYRGLCA